MVPGPSRVCDATVMRSSLRTRLLTKGLQLSDRMSEVVVRPSVMAPTFRDSQLTPLAQFPYNSFPTARLGESVRSPRSEYPGDGRRGGKVAGDASPDPLPS